MKKKILALIASVAVCEFAGGIGSLTTMSSITDWYPSLKKAELNPPGWIFAPVWTILYALMGIAIFLVWKKVGRNVVYKAPLAVFIFQLDLNIIWSIVFFGLHNPLAAFVEVVVFCLSIAWTIVIFWKRSRVAAWLMVPYLLWVTFAAYLNYSIVILNK